MLLGAYPLLSPRRARPGQRRGRVEGYEVEYFARKHGITAEQVRGLIREHGNNTEVPTTAGMRRTRSMPTSSRPASSTRQRSCAFALQNASSVAALLITTEAMVAEHPKKDA
jgi:hypothetical protein